MLAAGAARVRNVVRLFSLAFSMDGLVSLKVYCEKDGFSEIISMQNSGIFQKLVQILPSIRAVLKKRPFATSSKLLPRVGCERYEKGNMRLDKRE